MKVQIEESWGIHLAEEFRKEYFIQLTQFIREEYSRTTVYPPGKQIFAAFDHCTFDKLKVMIIGQDPYHGPGQANGLCFSVNPGMKKPPSLQNIFKEIKSDLGKEIPEHGDLSRWADQGVMLLNATLTVRAHSPGSHQQKGWEIFTDRVIQIASDRNEHIVFLLWGAFAQKKEVLIDSSKHLILKSAHPSPFSVHRGFFRNKHFSKTNEYLISCGKEGIDW